MSAGRRKLALGCAALLALLCLGHLNSPHVFLEENLGPYPVYIVAHMPTAVPGEAEVQLRFDDLAPAEAVRVQIREIPPQGEETAPGWVDADRSEVDPSFFTAPVPLMVYGLWHVDVRVEGARGSGTVRFPLSARVPVPRRMETGLSIALAVLTLLLFVTLWQISSSLGRQAHTGEQQTAPKARRRGWLWAAAAVISFGAFTAFILFGWQQFQGRNLIRSGPRYAAEVRMANPPPVAGKELLVQLDVQNRRGEAMDRVVPEHGKMMHLFAVAWPGAEHLLHVHPRMPRQGTFQFRFNPVREGSYRLFGDLLFATGEADTVTAEIEVGAGPPPTAFRFDDPDDAQAFQSAFGEAETGGRSFGVGDGLTMLWLSPEPDGIRAGDALRLEFELVDAAMQPVEALEPYAGAGARMLILRDDFDVFAHGRPLGTLAGRTEAAARGSFPSRVTFPYGFAEPGRYRIWVQMKYGGKIHTGAFDVTVE